MNWGLNLTNNQEAILNKVVELINKDKNINMTKIGKELNLSRALVSYNLIKFEERGLINRSGKSWSTIFKDKHLIWFVPMYDLEDIPFLLDPFTYYLY